MTDKEFILKHYPDAKLFNEPGGNYLVYINEFPVANEYMLPDVFEKSVAWEYARLALKTTQNFNRTHPDRLSLSEFEKKLDRIHRRKYNGKARSHEIARSNKK